MEQAELDEIFGFFGLEGQGSKKSHFPYNVDVPSASDYQSADGSQKAELIDNLAKSSNECIELLRSILSFKARLLSKSVDAAPKFLIDDDSFLDVLNLWARVLLSNITIPEFISQHWPVA